MTGSLKTCISLREDIVKSPQVPVGLTGYCQAGISQITHQSATFVEWSACARGSRYLRSISVEKRP